MKMILSCDSDLYFEWAEDPPDWDSYVELHPWGTIYHLTSWKRALEDAFPHIKGRFLLLRSSRDGQLHGGMPLYTVRSWLLGNRLVSIPFASFCDPLVRTEEVLRQLVDEAWRFAENSKISNLEIRLFRSAKLAEEAGLNPKLYSRHHFTSLTRPAEELWGSFSKTSIKQPVKRAMDAGIWILNKIDDATLDIFVQMLANNRRRNALPYLPDRFFKAMKRKLGQDRLSCWIAASPNGSPLAGLLGWRLGDNFAVEYSADFHEARAKGANQLLYWHVMKDVQASGCVAFSFGRTGLDNAGLLNYKRRWGTVEEDLKIIMLPEKGGDIIKKENLLFRIAKKLISKSPPYINRIIGEFCYRHLG